MSDFFKEMYNMCRATTLGEILNVFSPFALSGNVFDEFYAETNEARGDDASKKVILRLTYNGEQVKKILFMGHSGCGKSTELFKIEKELEDRYLIVKFSVKEETDIINFKSCDLIFSILNNIFNTVNNSGYPIHSHSINNIVNYWNDEKILQIVGQSSIEASADLEAKIKWFKILSAKIKGIFQTGVEAKQEIRRKMEPSLKQLLIYINEFVQQVNEKIYPKKLLLIIEDLDKLILDQAQDLFIENRKIITSININTIYTFPIYLFYSAYFTEIMSDFDADILLSMIKVKEINGNNYTTGINTLKHIVEKRCDLALFEEGVLKFLIMKSGGSIRDLFNMINNAALNTLIDLGEDKKITIYEAKKAYYTLKSTRERIIKKEHLPILEEIYADKTKKPFGDNQDLLMQLLHSLCVIEYNGKRWCDLHPCIKDYLIEKDIIHETQESV